jgi:predicted RecB family nuclease
LKEIDRIFRNDPVLDALKKRGQEHEAQYVKHLISQGKTVTDSSRKSIEATLDAMREGKDVIVQGRLSHDQWEGFPDILLRVDGSSRFGNWSYEVQDTKLSTNTKTTTIIQSCFYTDLLEKIQEAIPQKFHVVVPGDISDKPFKVEEYSISEFKAYYNFVKNRFSELMENSPLPTYPDEVEHCSICNWWSDCDKKRRADDHLCLVAGIRKSQIEELKKQDIATLKSFALAEKLNKPERGNFEILVIKQLQAKIQLEGRVAETLIHKPILPAEENRGFNRLPEPSPGDVYLDIEGDAFFPGGSLEYLFGIAYYENGTLQYEKFWATNRLEEKHAFEKVMQFLLDRLKLFPSFSLYHYGVYEQATVKRLAHRYAVNEQELDDLLRKEKFVDLHSISKESLIASVEQYSLKDLEKFTKFVRKADLREAAKARKRVESALQLKEFEKLPLDIVQLVQTYNEDDCIATEALHKWLEKERQSLISKGFNFSRPTPGEEPPSEELLLQEKRSKLLFESLTRDLPDNREAWQDEHHAKWLLANQLQYFRRENKSAWWEHFRLQKGEIEDLLTDRKAIVGLTLKDTISPGDIPVDRYSFPDQDVNLKEGDNLFIVNSFTKEKPYGVGCGKIVAIDSEKKFLDIKKTRETATVHPTAVHEYDIITIEKLWKSILAIAVEVDFNGLSRMGDYRAAKDLLMNRKPQLINQQEGAVVQEGEDLLQAASRIALNLNRSILPIQGPPGTGKTFTGAHMIMELLKAKKKIGVTAVSHRVITTLFETIHKEAEKNDLNIQFAHKVSEKMDLPEWIAQIKDQKKLKKAIEACTVVGGTAWLWADDDFTGSLDYLFVDEAGQMSLSQVLAASRAADNIILLGDPQQLEQPQRGAHPENSDVAALTYLLDGEVVMPKEKGLFLNFTRRINPAIAKFTSEIFYKGQLDALPELKNQIISGGTRFDGAGLFYVPVIHEGNPNRSIEEIGKIREIVQELLGVGSWANAKGEVARITEKDILIVAPYNAQVDALKEALPEIDIGTVDKFQGREAPVVIYSMAASTVLEAPRGLDFLFNPNRLNVATSRAKCGCILVASPTLFEAECNSIEQMKWANALCRYRELSKIISV